MKPNREFKIIRQTIKALGSVYTQEMNIFFSKRPFLGVESQNFLPEEIEIIDIQKQVLEAELRRLIGEYFDKKEEEVWGALIQNALF